MSSKSTNLTKVLLGAAVATVSVVGIYNINTKV
jgi:hypothetical protein